MIVFFPLLDIFLARYVRSYDVILIPGIGASFTVSSGAWDVLECESVGAIARRMIVAVFKYSAVVKNREEMSESGTIVASNEQQAREKLERLDLTDVRLKRISGISGLLKSLTADIR